LDLAKNYREDKNSICLFGEPMGWEEMEQCEEIKSKLLDLVVNRGESRSLLQRIKSSDLGFRSVQDKMMDTNKIDLPKVYRLKYYLRNAKTEENRKILTIPFCPFGKEKKAALYGIEYTIPIALPYIHPWIMVPSWSLHKSQLFTIEGEISL